MNEYLSFLILGLAQGITEFLPVSSSGHLVLLERLGVGEPNVLNNLLLHCATLLVVLVFYRKKIFDLLRHPTCPQMRFLLLASLPTALLAGVIRFLLPDASAYLPFFFFVTSFLLLLPSLLPKPDFVFENKAAAKALFVGAMQGVACFAGVSRSGATASALLLAGCPKEKTGEYSFLLSVPIIVGSSAAELLTGSAGTLTPAVLPGFAAAFISGSLSLKLFSGVLKNDRLPLFSVYTAALGVLSFFLLFR